MPINREITFANPKQVGKNMVANRGVLSHIFIEADSHNPYFDGGAFSDKVPIDYLSLQDKKIAEDYIAMMLRQSSTGEAKARKQAADDSANVAEEAKRAEEAKKGKLP